jgi:hypothetical protein
VAKPKSTRAHTPVSVLTVSLRFEGSGCKDINECESPETNNCDVNGRCVNIPGDYFCVCNSGYEGYGREGGRTAMPAPTAVPSVNPLSAPSSTFAPSPAPTPRPCRANGDSCTSNGQCCSDVCKSPI